MHVIVKQSERRIDPKHPESTDPSHAWAERRAGEWAKKHPPEFVSEGARRDYERSIKANPRNFYGAPAFFPELEGPRKGYEAIHMSYDPEKEFLEHIKQVQVENVELLCVDCIDVRGKRFSGLTEHSISPDDCFCTRCGTHKPYRVN